MINKNLLRILFIEDLPSDVDLAVLELRKEKLTFDYTTVCTRDDLVNALKEFKPDLIISDYMMPSFNGLQALKIVNELDPDIPFILCTGSVNEETAVKCIKAGALDYVIKEHMTRLPFAVKEALEQVIIQKEKRASWLLLRESEEKLQSVFAVAPVGIGLVVNRVILEVNDTFCNIIGYKRSELIGKSSKIIYATEEEYELVGKEKYRQIAENGSGSVETIFKCKDGKILNVILSSAPLDKDDLSKGVTFTVLDITDRKKVEAALIESEDRFRTLYNDALAGLYRTNSTGEIILANHTLVKMLGFQSFEELAAINLNKSGIGTNLNRKKFIAQIEKEGEINDLESIWICRNGKEIYVRENAKLVRDTDGKVLYYDGIVEDITNSKLTEIELRKLSRAVEQSPVSIVITDINGNIEYINPKFCEVTGYSRDELIGKNPRVLSSGEKGRDEYKLLWDTILAGNEWKGELHNKKKNGDLYWESASISPIKNEREEITHFLGIKEDITLRKILEAASVASELRYHELFLNNPVPTYIFDENTLEFIEVNDAAVQNYGYSREEFSSLTLRDFRLPEDISDLLESVKELGKEVFYSTTMRHRKKNGIVFPVELTSHSLPEKNGRKTRLVIAIDITERIKASEQMKLAKEKAEASDNLKTTFLNNISHEVRTPLNGILGFAEIMSRPDLSETDKSDSLLMLHESSDRLLDTITNYMDISLLASGNLSVHTRVFYPGQVLQKLFDSYKTKCSERKLDLVLEITKEDNSLLISSDPEILYKIISHLLNNAIKFTEKGRINYGCNLSNDKLEFFVKDTGIGIDKESINSIFDRFVKGDLGPSKLSEGSGLGLSIAKGMIEIIGGKIWVESEIGVGSCFFFTIPVTNGTELKPSVLSDNGYKKNTQLVQILVAEDDETNFFYLNALLARETKATVLHASNGREAVEIFKKNPDIQLILMDIKMPEIEGLEATRQIKLLKPDVPIIAITAYAMSGDEQRVLAAGCDGYLSKPLSKKALLDKMAEFIKI